MKRNRRHHHSAAPTDRSGDADPASPPEPLLTVQEVAHWLKVSPRFVYERSQRGELALVRVGRYSRFRREDVERYLKECSSNGR